MSKGPKLHAQTKQVVTLYFVCFNFRYCKRRW